MLDAGVEVLNGASLGFSLDALGYKAVFDHLQATRDVRVTYGSVHERIWASQRDFQLEVLTAAAQRLSEENVDAFAGPAVEVVGELPLTTPDERRYAAQELTRVAMNHTWEQDTDSNQLFRTLRYLCAGVSMSLDDTELVEVIAGMRRRAIDGYQEVVLALIEVIGLRARSPLTIPEAARELAQSTSAVTTGLDVDAAVMAREPVVLATGRDGEDQSWHPLAWATWMLTRGLLELDGDLEPAERVL